MQKFLQRKYDNEGEVLFGEQQVQSIVRSENFRISQASLF